jgi:hypothetical protein
MMLDADKIDEIVIYDGTSQETTTFVKPKVVVVDGAQLDSTQVEFKDPSTKNVELVSFQREEGEESTTCSINSPDSDEQSELPWDLSECYNPATGEYMQTIKHIDSNTKELICIDPKTLHGATPVSDKVLSPNTKYDHI